MHSKTTILIAEDDANIRHGLVLTLESEGFAVHAVADGDAALKATKNQRFDLILLDVMMPKMSGFDACQEIRRADAQTPIVMLTAKGEEIDKVVGLRLGADDYITKPFGIHELLARIEAALRRSRTKKAAPVQAPPAPFVFGAVEVDPGAFRVKRSGRAVAITQRELDLILIFVNHPDQVLTREVLLERCWGMTYTGTTRTLDQHIAQLRKKVEPNPGRPRVIETVHGTGYRYVPLVARAE